MVSRELHGERLREKNFLYTVLDLPIFATEAEIKERHRALSLVFHPDRQHDERLKEIAKENFLEIQLAYEVLSDPFRREIYDILGFEGLEIQFPNNLKTLPVDELRPALRGYFYEHRAQQLQSQIDSHATVVCSLDARELFYDGWHARDWVTDLSERLTATRMRILSLRHTFSRHLGQQTKLQVISRVGLPVDDEEDQDTSLDPGRFTLLRGNISGVITHRYSVTKQLQVRANLMNLRSLSVSWMHTDKLNILRVSVPLQLSPVFPPITLSFRRRLFRNSLTLGAVDCVLNQKGLPAVNIGVTNPPVIRKGTTFASGWDAGFNLRGRMPGPTTYFQWRAVLLPLSMILKIGSEFSFLGGLANTIEGSWHSETEETDISSAVVWNHDGVVLRLSVTHLGQTFVLPIRLSDENLSYLVILATLAQASAFALAEYFFLRKLRAKTRTIRREEHEQAQQDQHSQRKAEAEAVIKMLESAAHRSYETEKGRDGLVILEARYFPIEDNGIPMPDLGIDVTKAVQALVHNRQLYIPGESSKSLLRGFYDPLPECSKCLSVRYEFRGRMHYAEIGEHAPLVLPLESHLVEHMDDKWSKPNVPRWYTTAVPEVPVFDNSR
ncbi:hypothetical protein ACEPAF_2423 [Sanghuangporus sanghuang]